MIFLAIATAHDGFIIDQAPGRLIAAMLRDGYHVMCPAMLVRDAMLSTPMLKWPDPEEFDNWVDHVGKDSLSRCDCIWVLESEGWATDNQIICDIQVATQDLEMPCVNVEIKGDIGPWLPTITHEPVGTDWGMDLPPDMIAPL